MKTAKQMRAELLAREAIMHYGLACEFRWLRHVARPRMYGQFRARRGIYMQIALAPAYVENAPMEKVRNTILHEIAHALAYTRHGRDCGHGIWWKRIAEEVGAVPKATAKWHSMETPRQ